MKNQLLIYGCYGYTGRLIVKQAQLSNVPVILAGRNVAKLNKLGSETGYPTRVFSLDHPELIVEALHDVKAVLHAAGPFSFTASQMIHACLQTGVHYLDITGEIDVFELAASLHQQALASNIMLMPGTGFDVVPTDCLALSLKQRLPDATHMELAFGKKGGGISHGTATSLVYKLGSGGAERIDGILVRKPLGHKFLQVKVEDHKMFTVSIPWGDLSTAYRTTGIPNITAFTEMPKTLRVLLKAQSLINPLLRKNWLRKWLLQKIDARPAGPTDEQRSRSRSFIWGRVRNSNGKCMEAGFSAPEAYTLTALTAWHIAQKVMDGQWKAGYQTPAGCYGSNLVFELPGIGPLQWKVN